MKLSYKLLCLIWVIFQLSGCVSMQASNFKDTSSAYREVVEQYSNDNILLNIVRASKNMPMSFLDIPSIVGSGSYTGTAGINSSGTYNTMQSPLDAAARPLSSVTSTYGGALGMAVNNSFTFTQSSLDNAHFMGKFLEDVPPETIKFYGSQKNLPREAMLLLLIDNIEIRTSDNEEIAWWVNNPRSKDYALFQKFIRLLLDVGLTVEPFSEKEAIGPSIDEKQFIQNYSQLAPLLKDINSDGDKSLEKVVVNGKTHYQLYKTKIVTRFCINKYKAENLFGNKLGRSSYCTDSPKSANQLFPDEHSEFLLKNLYALNPKNKELQLRVKLRSTANVFDYLGNALLAQYSDPSNLIMITSKDISVFKPNYEDPPVTAALFKVYKNGQVDNSASKVTYKSDVYHIKDNDGTYTTSVFELLSTLLTLSKRINSIPPSPTILVR